uniref:Uncharacterized protein n=1 Tax=Anopheles atroparvus TaxID=41427 RepID=A0A182J929_ANOAO
MAWFVSGNTSSSTARSAEIRMRSPRSGETCSATTSWFVVSGVVPLHLLRLPPNGGMPFPLRWRSFLRCSICLIIAASNEKATLHSTSEPRHEPVAFACAKPGLLYSRTISKYLASSSSSSRSGKSSDTSSLELRMKLSMWRNMPPSRSMNMLEQFVKTLLNFMSTTSVCLSMIVPPTSMCTGAVYLEAAATHGMPVICLWFAWWYPLPTPVTAGEPAGMGGVGVGDDELEMVGEVVGEVLILICVAVNRRVADRSRGSSGFTSRSVTAESPFAGEIADRPEEVECVRTFGSFAGLEWGGPTEALEAAAGAGAFEKTQYTSKHRQFRST